MLDIRAFREDPGSIRDSEDRRGKDPGRVDRVIELDKEWRETRQELDELRHQRNVTSDEIAELKQEGEEEKAEEKIEEMERINSSIEELEEREEELKEERDAERYHVGNILHEDVPEGDDEEDYEEVRKWGELPDIDEPEHHADIVDKLDMVDTEKAGEVSGSRFFYMKKDIVKLHLALQQFALEKMEDHDFVPFYTPFVLKHEQMKAAAELEAFEETLYEIKDPDERKFLIATSEQTLAAYHHDEILDPDDLPLKYAGVSSCFRREAGSHGKDTKGIFRVHQFDKVEQFVFCEPGESWDMHEKMLTISEDIMQDLGLHYRVVEICAGDMNDNAARKYDIEAWYPAQERYRELVSCSNNTDYQARKLKVRMRGEEENEMVHVLNATAWPGQRGITAILVQNQEDGRIKIPGVLQDRVGKEHIEF